jgi:hypothetical protein
MEQPDGLLNLANMLAARLGRLSADSTWARRASGVRGALLKAIDEAEAAGDISGPAHRQLDLLVHYGFELLEKAAREMG